VALGSFPQSISTQLASTDAHARKGGIGWQNLHGALENGERGAPIVSYLHRVPRPAHAEESSRGSDDPFVDAAQGVEESLQAAALDGEENTRFRAGQLHL